MIVLSPGGIIQTDHVALVAPIHSEPIKRFVTKMPEDTTLNLTYGYPRQAVILFTNGYLAIVSQTVEELAEQLKLDGSADVQFDE